jgi:opacity protein-like surface antigen
MFGSWRPLIVAAALSVTMTAAASAQTVMVLRTAPGGAVDVAMNADLVGSATADQQGKASVTLGPGVMGGRPTMNVRVYVDACDSRRRVVLVEPGAQAIAPENCARQDIAGVYRLLPVSTFVVDVSGEAPSVRLRQGPAPGEWFLEEAELALRRSRPDVTPRPGFMFFAAGGLNQSRDAVAIACGNVTDCSGGGTKLTAMGGTTVWFTRFFGIEAAYLKPLAVKSTGKGDYYAFDNNFSTHVVLATAKVGWPLERARPYVMGGINYTWSTSTTEQSVDDTTVTVDEVTTTIPGGTQTFELKTKGLGWTVGAGVEIPVTRMWTIYTEAGGYKAKGDDVDGGEGRLDDRMLYWVVGLKLRLGN